MPQAHGSGEHLASEFVVRPAVWLPNTVQPTLLLTLGGIWCRVVGPLTGTNEERVSEDSSVAHTLAQRLVFVLHDQNPFTLAGRAA